MSLGHRCTSTQKGVNSLDRAHPHPTAGAGSPRSAPFCSYTKILFQETASSLATTQPCRQVTRTCPTTPDRERQITWSRLNHVVRSPGRTQPRPIASARSPNRALATSPGTWARPRHVVMSPGHRCTSQIVYTKRRQFTRPCPTTPDRRRQITWARSILFLYHAWLQALGHLTVP
jgi:hypothetical protein